MIAQDDPSTWPSAASCRAASPQGRARARAGPGPHIGGLLDAVVADVEPGARGRMEAVDAVAAAAARPADRPPARLPRGDLGRHQELVGAADALRLGPHDAEALGGFLAAIGEFVPCSRRRPPTGGMPRPRPRHHVGRGADGYPMDDDALTRRACSSPAVPRPPGPPSPAVAGGLRRAPRPVGGRRRRPDPRPRPGRGVIRWVTPLNNMFRGRPPTTDIGGQPVRAGDRMMLALPVGQPRRGRVRRAVPLRHPPRPEPPARLRAGHPLLRRRQPRPPRAAPPVRAPSPSDGRTSRSLSPPDIEPNIFAGAVRRFDLGFTRRP